MPPDIEASRRTISGIYEKHGFRVEEWTGPLRCKVSAADELRAMSQDEIGVRILNVWKEIDAVIHEEFPGCGEDRHA